MTDLGTLGGTISYGEAINASSQVVGQAYLSGNAAAHAFLYSNGTMSDLNAMIGPAASLYTLVIALGINDSGQIVANGYINSTEQGVVLLLTPTNSWGNSTDGPIPLWALGALSAGLVGIASRRLQKSA
jgi:probable HAF family extracellular repeat protein